VTARTDGRNPTAHAGDLEGCAHSIPAQVGCQYISGLTAYHSSAFVNKEGSQSVVEVRSWSGLKSIGEGGKGKGRKERRVVVGGSSGGVRHKDGSKEGQGKRD
jgi:hypothetical protein